MAILTKAEYISYINTVLPDNSTQEISPLDVRNSLINLADSVGNLTEGLELKSSNFRTPDVRTTIAGETALSKIDLPGRSSVDNTAVGYFSLGGNYTGSGNTAVGTFAQSCNLYGNGNSSVGYLSQAANVTGSGNVSIGSYSLHNNKRGSLNIAIGHGASYFLGPEESYVLSIGSYDIDESFLCDENDEPIYSGGAPLLYGDLKAGQHKLGVGVGEFHQYGMLQVSGGIAPTTSGDFALGYSQKPWASINDDIYFSGQYVGVGGNPSGDIHGVQDAKMTSYGDFVPSRDERFALGHPNLKWDAYLNDVIISGQLTVNDFAYNAINYCLYDCKTLHLATSGFCDPEDDGFHNSAVCGFLDDTSLDGAGFEIHSSGATYRRDYRFIYRYPDVSLNCLPDDNPYTRSRFESNISLEVTSGAALITERVLGREEVGLVIDSGCMGVWVEPYAESGQRVVVAQEPQYSDKYPTLVDVNMISRSGTHVGGDGNPVGYDYSVMYGTVDSGVQVTQQFASRIKSASTIRGFSIVYYDELDQD
tara:strand:+ start:13121 stop:14722 length:1602 start_codon:yes stop_codon:yes gene_type:complete